MWISFAESGIVLCLALLYLELCNYLRSGQRQKEEPLLEGSSAPLLSACPGKKRVLCWHQGLFSKCQIPDPHISVPHWALWLAAGPARGHKWICGRTIIFILQGQCGCNVGMGGDFFG